MEKKVHCFCKDQGGNHGIHTKGISWMYLNKKKNAFIGHCAKRPRDDALVDEYNINDRAMILKIGRFFLSSRTSRLVQQILCHIIT